MSRQHGNLSLREIDGGPSLESFSEKRIFRSDIMGHVRDMHAYQVIPVLFLNGKGIVKVQSGGAVNGHGAKMGKVLAGWILEQFVSSLLEEHFRLLDSEQGENHRLLITEQRNVLIVIPDPGFDQKMEGVVGPVEACGLQDLSGNVSPRKICAKEIKVTDDTQTFFLLGIVKSIFLFSVVDFLKKFCATLDEILIPFLFFPMLAKLLYLFRRVGQDTVFSVLEEKSVHKNRTKKSRNYVVIGIFAKTQFCQKGWKKAVVRFVCSEFPYLLEVDSLHEFVSCFCCLLELSNKGFAWEIKLMCLFRTVDNSGQRQVHLSAVLV